MRLSSFATINTKCCVYLFLIVSCFFSLSQSVKASNVNEKEPINYEEIIKKYTEDLRFKENIGKYPSEYKYALESKQINVGFTDEKIYSWVFNPEKTKGFTWVTEFLDRNPTSSYRLKNLDLAKHTYLQKDEEIIQQVGKELWINELYKGINLRYYSRGDQLLEYDFLVDPCEDPTQIKYRLDGFDKLSVSEDGRLKMNSPFGDLFGSKPYAYQMINGQEVEVAASYKVEADQISFEIGDYDESAYLVIDPIVLEWSTFLEGSNTGEIFELDVNGAGVYAVGSTQSTDFPVTAGVFQPNYSDKIDAYVAKLTHAGQLEWATYFGGTSTENDLKIEIVNGSILIGGTTVSEDLPTTAGVYQENYGGSIETFMASFTDSGMLNWSTYIGGTEREGNLIFESDGTRVFFAGTTSSDDLDVPMDAYQATYQGDTDNFLGALDFNTGTMNWISYLGGSDFEGKPVDLILDGNNLTLAVERTFSLDLPLLNANQMNNGGQADAYIAQFQNDGTALWLTYIGGDGNDWIFDFDFDGTSFYLGGLSSSTDLATAGAFQEVVIGTDCWLASINNAGFTNWSTYINGNSQTGIESGGELITNIEVDNGHVYFIANTSGDFPFSSNLLGPITQGASWYPDIVVGRFTIGGQYSWSTYYAGENIDRGEDIEVANGFVYVLGYINSSIFPISDYAVQELPQGGDQPGLGMFKEESGELVYSTYFGGATKGQFPDDLEVFGQDVYFAFCGAPQSPVTTNAFQSSTMAGRAGVITKFTPIIGLTDNIIGPSNQTTCQFGVAEELIGNQVFASNTLPQINYGSITIDHPEVEASYQWQQADDPAGPWEDIPIGITQNYLPFVTNITQFYRRVARFECTGIENISAVATVSVNDMVALQVDAGPPFYTCPGEAITIGGMPTASNGAMPYSYDWDMEAFLDDETSANPTATVTETTIFSVIVTDANGCSQIGQTVITPVAADAGLDQTVCLGTPVQIGTAPLAGLTGATYAWSPITGLDNPNIAQPIANPSTSTTYFLMLTLDTPTGPCSTFDQVTVNQVPAPSDNFAGPDVVSCNTDPAFIGTMDEGFTYVWSPSTYLSNNTGATATVTPFFNEVPPNQPLSYTLQATMGDCVYEDEVEVAFVNTDAGIDFCGPRIVGDPAQTDLNPSYMWTNLTPGIGTITPPTNTAQVMVSASVGGTATYLLEVTYNGTTCTDEVDVPEGCEGCFIDIGIEPIGCPLLIDGGELTLFGFAAVTGYNSNQLQYNWTPTTGLSDPNSAVTMVTTMDNIVYTLTVTDLFGNFLCSAMIDVNNPNYSIPVFMAQDHEVCVGTSVDLGQAPVVGYEYEWLGPDNYVSNESNPTVIAQFDEEYYVTVTETETGCVVLDTATINVSDVLADAGGDIEICSGGIITLGVPDLSNGTWSYNWEPVNSPWQNGTNENSPQPEVLVVTDLQFSLTVTDLAKCFDTDVINITVNDDIALEDAPDVVYCPGNEPIQIGPEPINGVTYSWSPTTDLSCVDCAQPLASPSSTTIYTLSAMFPGCEFTVTDNVIVTVPDYTFDLGGPLTYCPSDGPVSIGDNAPIGVASFQWTPNLNLSCNDCPNPTSNTLVEQTYTLTVTYEDGCSASADITVIPSVLPNAGQDYVICLEESVTLGTPSTSDQFIWTPTDGLSCTTCATPIFTPPSTGIFQFNLTEINGTCQNEDQVTVTVLGNEVPDLQTSTVCENGCVLLQAPFFDNHNYVWSPADGLSDPTSNETLACPDETTNYTVVIEDQIFGCITSANALVVVSPQEAPVLTIGDFEYCVEDPPILLDLQVNPPNTGDYSFSWSPQVSLSNPFIQQPIATPQVTTTYYVTVTDNTNGCASVAESTVTVVPCFDCDMVLNATGNSPTCEVDEIMLFVNVTNGTGPFFYSWLGPLGYQSTQQNPVIPNATTQMSGIYTVLVTDANGCTETAMVDMQVFEDPTLSIDIAECTDGLNSYFVVFSSNGTVSTTAGTITGNQILNIPLGTDIVVTAALNGCTVEIPVMSPECPCPTIDPPINPMHAEICEGDPNPSISVSVAPGIVVDWYDAGMGGNLLLANSTSFTPTGTLSLGLHTFYAEAVDLTNGCSSTTRTPVTIFVNENPTLEVSSNSPVCTTTDIELYATVSGGAGPYIFSWTGPGGFTSMNQNPIIPNASFAMSGTYTVTVYTGNNCSATQSIDVILQQLPTLDITATNCDNGANTFTITFQTNGTVTASNGTISGNQVINIPDGQDVTLIAELNGCYRFVLVEGLDCGCPDIFPPMNPMNGEICHGEPIPTLSVTVDAGQTVNWYDAPVAGNLLAANTTSFTPPGPLNPGVYSYYAETANIPAECPSPGRTEVVLIIHANPTVQLSTFPVCEGGTASISTTVTGGTAPYQFFWTGPNGYNSNIQNPMITMASLNDAGNYLVIVIDALGCVAEADIDVVVEQQPFLLITNVYCAPNNNSYTIDFSSNGIVSTSAGSISGNQVLNIPIGVNVTLNSTLGSCDVSANVTSPVCECPMIFPPINPIHAEICDGETIPSLSVSVPAGQTVNWYDAPTGGNLLASNTTSYTPSGPLGPGIYTYYAETFNLEDECTSSTRTEVFLIIHDQPSINLETEPICALETLIIASNVSGGNAPYTYEWSGPNNYSSSSQDVSIANATNLNEGTYFVTVTDTNGCSSEDFIDAVINPLPTLIVTNVVCSPDFAFYSIEFTSTGLVSSSAGTVSGNEIVNIPANVDVVLTAILNTCEVVVLVTAPDCACPMIAPPINPINGEICEGETTPALMVSVPAGNTVNWYDAAIGGNLIGTGTSFIPIGQFSAGVYTFYVETFNTDTGCTSNTRTPVFLFVNPNPIIMLMAPEVCEGETIFINTMVTGGSAPYTYSWTGPANYSSTTQSPQIPNATSLNGGVYFVTVIDANACSSESEIDVTVDPSPFLTIDEVVCANDNNSFSITFTSNGTVTSNVGTVVGNQVVNIPSGQNASLMATLGNCSITVAVNDPMCTCPPVDAPINPIPAEICEGEATPTICVSVGANETVFWYDAPTGGNILLESSLCYTPPGILTPGVYTYYAAAMNVIDDCFSDTRTPVTITVYPNPLINLDIPSVCEGETIVFNVSTTGGQSPYTYNWTGPNGFSFNGQTPIINNAMFSDQGIYTVVVTDANGCMDTAMDELIVHSNPSITIDDVVCTNDENWYTITFTATGVVTSNIGTVVGNQVIDIPADQNAILTVTLGNCSISITVNAPMCACPHIDAPINGTPTEICEAEPNPTICVSVGAGETVFWYDAPSGGNILLESNLCYTPSGILTPGVYTYYAAAMNIIDDCFSNTRTPVSITVHPNPIVSLADAEVCEGENAILVISISGGQGPFTYNWTGPNGFTSSSQNPIIPNAQEVNEGTYMLMVIDANGCMGSGEGELVVNPNPVLEIIDRDCNDDLTSYSIDFMSNGMVSTNAGTVVGNQVINIPSGTVVSITSILGDCSTSMIVNPPDCECPMIMAPVNPINGAICFGEPIPTVSVTVSVGQTVNWYDAPSGGNLLASDTNSYTPSGPLSIGTYTYFAETINQIDGCPSDSRTPVIIEVFELPTISGTDIEACVGQSVPININFNSTESISSIQWNGPNGFVSTQEDILLTNVSTAMTGIYQVVVTNIHGCQATIDIGLSVNDLPVINLIDRICSEDMDSYTIVFESNGLVTSDYGTVQGNMIVDIPADQDVCVSATIGFCNIEDKISAPDCSCPFIFQPLNPMNAGICEGDDNPTISAEVDPPFTINWYDAVLNGNLLLENSLTFTPTNTLPVGTHTFYAETYDPTDNCTSSVRTPVSIRVDGIPTINLMTSPVCEGESLEIMATVSGLFDQASFSWTGPQNFQSSEQNISIANASTLNQGTYILSIISGANCLASQMIETSVNSSPFIEVEEVLCQGVDQPYTVEFSSNGTVTSSFGTIVGNQVINIPDGQGISLTAILGDCETTRVIMAPDCSCPEVAAPTNPNHQEICLSDDVPMLSVEVPNGISVNWYDAPIGGTLLLANSTSFTPPTPSLPGISRYYAQALIAGSLCMSEERTPVFFTVNDCPCDLTTMTSISCNDNNTSWDSTDDYIEISIDASMVYGSGSYQVAVDGVNLGSTTNINDSYTIIGNGLGGNPILLADGTSSYSITVFDSEDATCFDTFEVSADPCSNDYFDLALRKVNTEASSYHRYGDDVDFEITVCNQGSLTATEVIVADYLSDGYIFNASNNPSWNLVNGVLETTINQINVDQCQTVALSLQIAAEVQDISEWINYAEILSAKNGMGVDMNMWDIDSNPGSDTVFERAVLPGDSSDNDLESADKGGEEDDHDPAGIQLLDLALTKQIDLIDYSVGDLVEFRLDIYNQGNVEAFEVSMVDYLPAGLSFDATENNGWSLQTDGNLSYTLDNVLLPGESTQVILNLYIVSNEGSMPGDWYNEAEVSAAHNSEGDLLTDADSYLDDDPSNDNDLVDGPDPDNIFNGDNNDNVINELVDDPFNRGDDDEDDNDAVELFVTGQIGDFVWKDLNGDGLQDDGEPGVSNVVVNLFDCSGGFLTSTTTNSDGFYQFDDLNAGDYQLQFDLSNLGEECLFTENGNPLNSALNSDVNLAGWTSCVSLKLGEQRFDIDAGLIALASLGNYVWHDRNGDGIAQQGEEPIEGVRVNLYDAQGNFVAFKLTDGNGNYSFSQLYPGEYYIGFNPTGDYEFTLANRGGDDKNDSDVDNANGIGTTQIIALESGEYDDSWDAGLYICAKLGELVWLDAEKNDVYDDFENGINGVKVEVFKSIDGDYILYDFVYTGVKPGTPSDDGYWKMCLPPGTYYLRFSQPPFGLVTVRPNVGSNASLDSDVTDENGMNTTGSFTLYSGDEKCDVLAGYYAMAMIGDRVWLDTDGDGQQDLNEPGVEGVEVEVRSADNTHSITEYTDANGYYEIDELKAKDYYVRLVPPSGYQLTLANVGDEETDSDVDHTNGPNTTKTVSLNSGDIMPHLDAGLVSSVLAEQWIELRAESKGDHHVLSWLSNNESDFNSYQIQRSFDGISYEVLTNKPVNIIGESNYVYMDFDLEIIGNYYYKVINRLDDGSIISSEVVQLRVDKTASKDGLRANIYPNPTNGFFTVDVYLDKQAQECWFTMFDAQGAKAMKTTLLDIDIDTGWHKYQIDGRDLPAGMFEIQVRLDDQFIQKKLIKLDNY